MIFDLDGTPADIGFPDVRLAESEPNGLLAIGGDLSQTRLIAAYRHGIFPWYNAGQPILWWSPAPRMVLFPAEFHVSRSLRKTLRRNCFEVSLNQAFDRVIAACAAPRDPGGTWLLPEMIQAYQDLHAAGFAHSLEVWAGEELVGGLYGVAVGRMFYGESMFSRRPDASKVAMAVLTDIASSEPLDLIDCQIHTNHLASLGARELDREQFGDRMARAVAAAGPRLDPQSRRPTDQLGWAR